MARIRTIKPELAAHEELYDLEIETGLPIRFAWCMLFTVADREGRFQLRPRTLKAQILPHDKIDFSRVLDAWFTRGFVQKYRVGNEVFGWIPTFTKHQVINNRESASDLPSIEEADEVFQPLTDASATRQPREDDACPTREVHAQGERKEGKGRERKERKGKERTSAARTPAPEIAELKAIYPKRSGSNPWPAAERAINARLAEGHTWTEILDGALRYAEYCRVTQSVGTQFVKLAASFCGPDKHFLDPWTPPRTKAEAQQDANIDAAHEWLARSETA
jgi:hypothetical protein